MIAFEILARATGGEGVKSGPIGLAVILVLCVAAYFLFKSMSKHLKRVRENFPSDDAESPTEVTETTQATQDMQAREQTESPATTDDPAQSEPERRPSSGAAP